MGVGGEGVECGLEVWGSEGDGERPTCLFMVPMALVTPFMACAIELLDLSVWILRDTAWMLARISTNLRT